MSFHERRIRDTLPAGRARVVQWHEVRLAEERPPQAPMGEEDGWPLREALWAVSGPGTSGPVLRMRGETVVAGRERVVDEGPHHPVQEFARIATDGGCDGLRDLVRKIHVNAPTIFRSECTEPAPSTDRCRGLADVGGDPQQQARQVLSGHDGRPKAKRDRVARVGGTRSRRRRLHLSASAAGTRTGQRPTVAGVARVRPGRVFRQRPGRESSG